MKKIIVALICIVCAVATAAAIACIYVVVPQRKFKSGREALVLEKYDNQSTGGDKIHFLNTGSSDAILLESNGLFALIDAGEDTDNPRGFSELELEGYEQKVLDYLKCVASDENGIVRLDFVLGTHSHSDHIGGFDTVIADDSVSVGRAYLKEYNSEKITDYEVSSWDNQEVYDQMVNALNEKGVEIISQMDNEPFKLGNFTITLFNTDDPETDKKVGENDQSIGVLVEKNGVKAFLAGDIDNKTGDEDRLGNKIGKIDLLKVGHHSYSHSTTSKWLKSLMPELCVITNKYESVDMRTINRIERITSATILITGQEDGVIAEITDDGTIVCYNHIH